MYYIAFANVYKEKLATIILYLLTVFVYLRQKFKNIKHLKLKLLHIAMQSLFWITLEWG